MQTTRARQSPDNKNRWSAFAAQCPISCLCKIMCRIVNSINLRKCNVILPPKCMDSRPRKKKRFEWKNMNPFCPMMRIDVCDEIWSLMTISTTIIDTNCNQIENMNAKNRWQFNVPQIKCVHTETTARGKKRHLHRTPSKIIEHDILVDHRAVCLLRWLIAQYFLVCSFSAFQRNFNERMTK